MMIYEIAIAKAREAIASINPDGMTVVQKYEALILLEQVARPLEDIRRQADKDNVKATRVGLHALARAIASVDMKVYNTLLDVEMAKQALLN